MPQHGLSMNESLIKYFRDDDGAESMSCEYCTGHKVDRRAPLSPLYSFVQKLI